jgi:mannose-6-phosphate isomerase-like protein (cupin superfamily)
MDAFDLTQTFIHLGLGSTAVPMADFNWSTECMTNYLASTLSDGAEGRLVCIVEQDVTWDTWERHPAGEEVVFLLSGRVDLVQEIDGAEHVVPLAPGQATINPPNVWHTATVHEPGQALFITPGQGTEHRPR